MNLYLNSLLELKRLSGLLCLLEEEPIEVNCSGSGLTLSSVSAYLMRIFIVNFLKRWLFLTRHSRNLNLYLTSNIDISIRQAKLSSALTRLRQYPHPRIPHWYPHDHILSVFTQFSLVNYIQAVCDAQLREYQLFKSVLIVIGSDGQLALFHCHEILENALHLYQFLKLQEKQQQLRMFRY